MPYQSFETLEAWKEARNLKLAIRDLTDTFPADEKYRLTNQLIRCSRSIGAQIAEGHGRKTNADEIRFCVMARSSLSETLHHLIDAEDEQLITPEQMATFRQQIDKLEKLLNGYIKWLTSKIDNNHK